MLRKPPGTRHLAWGERNSKPFCLKSKQVRMEPPSKVAKFFPSSTQGCSILPATPPLALYMVLFYALLADRT